MNNTTQILSIIVASLLLGIAIIFSPPQAEALADWPYNYCYILGQYQASIG